MSIIEKLSDVNSSISVKSIFLVTGNRSYDQSGAKEAIRSAFPEAEITRFSAFQVNPQIHEVAEGTALYEEKTYDLMIAVGGGSALDVAKGIRFSAFQEQLVLDILTGKVVVKQISKTPMLAVPTTAGSGSEATPYSVLYYEQQKYTTADSALLPDFVYLDGSLTLSLPKYVTAYTGIDALVQGVEAFWAVDTNEEAQFFAKQAISLTLKHLKDSVDYGRVEDRTQMLKAAYYSGKAIAITKTTAAHAFSYYLSTHHKIPHGQAVGLLLIPCMLFNEGVTEQDVSDPRGVGYVKQMLQELYNLFGEENVQGAVRVVVSLMKDLDLYRPIREIVVSPEEHRDFIQDVNIDRLGNNPRLFTKNTVIEFNQLIFSAIWS